MSKRCLATFDSKLTTAVVFIKPITRSSHNLGTRYWLRIYLDMLGAYKKSGVKLTFHRV